MSDSDEIRYFKHIKRGDQSAFKQLFDLHYVGLCRHLYRIVPDNQLAQDLAQDVFIDLWNKKDQINIHTSLVGFLKTAGRNKLLNHLRRKNIKWDDLNQTIERTSDHNNGQRLLEHKEFEQKVHEAIDDLPPKCRTIFVLSRFEDMSYKQIAEHLSISNKTVENQISKALKYLRNRIYTEPN